MLTGPLGDRTLPPPHHNAKKMSAHEQKPKTEP
jgi:hypothetical protein